MSVGSVAPVAPRLYQDERLLCFLRHVRRDWRLFWWLEVMGMSFCISLAGILYLGDPEYILSWYDEEIFKYFQILQPSFVCVYNPGAITILALATNSFLTRTAERWRRQREGPVSTHSRASSEMDSVSVCPQPSCACIVGWLWWLNTTVLDAYIVWKLAEYPYMLGVVLPTLLSAPVFLVGLVRLALDKCVTRFQRSQACWYRVVVGWGIGTTLGELTWVFYYLLPEIAIVCGIIFFSLGILLSIEPRYVNDPSGRWFEAPLAALRNRDGILRRSIAYSIHFVVVAWAVELFIYVRFGYIK